MCYFSSTGLMSWDKREMAEGHMVWKTDLGGDWTIAVCLEKERLMPRSRKWLAGGAPASWEWDEEPVYQYPQNQVN